MVFNLFTPKEEPSTSTCITFSDLCAQPKQQRTVRKRAKPLSFVLISDEHVDYVSTKAVQTKKIEKTTRSKGAKKDDVPSKACKAVYGDKSDPKASEEWSSCGNCSAWFHETCGEESGIYAADGFFCKDCL